MKFIPLPPFERINSLLQGVEALGCLFTMRLEAFTARSTREERQLAATMAERRSVGSSQQVSPLVAPQFPPVMPSHDSFAAAGGMLLPPASAAAVFLPGTPATPPQPFGEIASPQPASSSAQQPAVDERLVFLVAALNAVHGDGYDFSVLTEADFLLVDPARARVEIDDMLRALPVTCEPAVGASGGAHEPFWGAIAAEMSPTAPGVDGPAGSSTAAAASLAASTMSNEQTAVAIAGLFGGECDFFLFRSPECDPTAERTVWSTHYFIYSRKRRAILSVLAFGEGNRYRGDDYGGGAAGAAGAALYGASSGTPTPANEDDDEGFGGEDEDDGFSYGKNRGFYT